MRSTFFLIMLFFISTFTSAQTRIEEDPKCILNKQTAKIDWENKNPKLYLIGSIAPIRNSKADKKFERKYKIEYYDFGCTPPKIECVIEYNLEILKLMEKFHGIEWKDKIRKDVVVD
jgi:hypothetical protein